MKQYCRYCAYLVVGDWPYCEKKERLIGEKVAKHVNECPDFVLNPVDAFQENEKGYRPRRRKTGEELFAKQNQISLLDGGIDCV